VGTGAIEENEAPPPMAANVAKLIGEGQVKSEPEVNSISDGTLSFRARFARNAEQKRRMVVRTSHTCVI
jgi:hypothetical protein